MLLYELRTNVFFRFHEQLSISKNPDTKKSQGFLKTLFCSFTRCRMFQLGFCLCCVIRSVTNRYYDILFAIRVIFTVLSFLHKNIFQFLITIEKFFYIYPLKSFKCIVRIAVQYTCTCGDIIFGNIVLNFFVCNFFITYKTVLYTFFLTFMYCLY